MKKMIGTTYYFFMKIKYVRLGLFFIFFLGVCLYSYAWESKIVFYDSTGKLIYKTDKGGNRIPDFSFAGYKGSGIPIPHIPVVKTLSPIDGDNTNHIQNALFEMSLNPKDENGFRGALLLNPGVYQVNGTIKLGIDGVVLRGSGNGDDPSQNTIIKAVGNSPHQRTVMVAGGGSSTKWQDGDPSTVTNIISDSVLVGSKSFRIEDASTFSIGDNIIIYHPCTAEWLAAVDSGGTFWYLPGAVPGVDLPWGAGSQPIVYNRNITNINENTIEIDAPVFNHLIRSLSQSYIYKYTRTGLRTHIGIENLRIDIETQAGSNEDHAWNAIDLYLIEDSWVKNCTMLHFGLSGIRCNTATKITVENCQALDPVSPIEGGYRYNFNVYTASQQILFKNCHASNGRHHYISNGKSYTSGCVFLDCTSEGAYASSEGHSRWSTGLLFDNLIELDGPRPGVNPRLLGLYNRGYYGTSHGWGCAHSVAWNCDVAAGDLIIQKPPTAQNYAIGCSGARITGNKPPSPFNVEEGYIEGSSQSELFPRSLYEAQLEDRISASSSVDALNSFLAQQPEDFLLLKNYPNPFNSNTRIEFVLKRSINIVISIFDILGSEVDRFESKYYPAGVNSVTWFAGNIPSGIYFIQAKTNNFSVVKRAVLIR